MESFKSYNIFNTVRPEALEPKAKKPMPFPLENLDEDIAVAYSQVSRIATKLKAAEENPVNHTPARQKIIKKLRYKINTCTNLLKDISVTCQQLWF